MSRQLWWERNGSGLRQGWSHMCRSEPRETCLERKLICTRKFDLPTTNRTSHLTGSTPSKNSAICWGPSVPTPEPVKLYCKFVLRYFIAFHFGVPFFLEVLWPPVHEDKGRIRGRQLCTACEHGRSSLQETPSVRQHNLVPHEIGLGTSAGESPDLH